MAGSLKDFVYTADDGTNFAVNLDESNTEAINGTAGDYDGTTVLKYREPSNLILRSAYYTSADGKRTIKCIPLTQAIYNALPTASPTIVDPLDPAGTATLSLARVRAERIDRLPRADDTGLDDGDAT